MGARKSFFALMGLTRQEGTAVNDKFHEALRATARAKVDERGTFYLFDVGAALNHLMATPDGGDMERMCAYSYLAGRYAGLLEYATDETVQEALNKIMVDVDEHTP